MTWDVLGIILKDHGVYVFAIAVMGWAYWQERKVNQDAARADKEDNKQMITALVEVRDALRSFREALETRFPKR
jgi:cbb3-type cytochrome oxidase subunit 3